MTRLPDTQCPSCAHYRTLARYAVPTCAKATHPHGGEAQQACVVAWDGWCREGKHFEAKR